MAHYAFINRNNLVVEVIVGRDEKDQTNGVTDWEEYYSTQRVGWRALRTSYNTRGGVHYDPATGEPSDDQSKALRKNYAGLGYQYDPDRNAFIPPKPFESWVLDETTCLWQAPVDMPDDGQDYTWDESVGEWVAVPEPTE